MKKLAAVIAGGAALWAAAIGITGGFTIAIAGLRVSSFDPVRPLVVAALAATLYVVAAGPRGAARDIGRVTLLLTPSKLGAILAIGVIAAGVGGASWAASGADAYGYVSHADLWLQGRFKVAVPLATAAPWPDALDSMTPFAWRPLAAEPAIVPVTAPGLPMLMAFAKAIAGHCAVFWVAPLCGGLAVWTVFAIGRRALGSAAPGLGAAWLLATSPVFLLLVKSPMSDVPATALWALAALALLSPSRRMALAAGAAAAAAMVVRPNLVPVAAVMGAWAIWREWRHAPERDLGRPAIFAAAALPGPLTIAWFNARVYGSPFTSGYGDVGSLFSPDRILINLWQYGGWLMETQTPLAIAGLLAILVPLKRIWPSAESRAAALLIGPMALVVWAVYCLYAPFDAWWYLRFLLPAFPAMCLGTAALASALSRDRGRAVRTAAAAAVFALGVHGLWLTVRLEVFHRDEGDRRYVTVAEIVGGRTEPSAVILTGQHVGSVNYYTGRQTLQFERFDPAWLDRAFVWLEAQGRHPYILLEDWERPLFEQRFAGSTLGRLAMAPVAAYKGRTSGTIYLFDPRRPDGPTDLVAPERHPVRCVAPRGGG